MIVQEETVVRLLDREVPKDMGIGMEGFVFDPEWVWTTLNGETMTGFLAASPCHGHVFVLRLVLREGSPIETLPILLRKFVRDCKERGFIGVLSYLDPKRHEERFLMQAVKNMGGVIFAKPQFLIAANLDSLGKW